MWRRILRMLVVIGLVLTIALGIAQDQEVLHIQSAVRSPDPDFTAYVAALTGTALTSSNRFEVLVNGNRVFPSMLAAIEGARKRISFETYIYSAGEVGEAVHEALEAAARARRALQPRVRRAGLEGRCRPIHRRRLRDAGCTVGCSTLPRWYALEELNYRTHRKSCRRRRRRLHRRHRRRRLLERRCAGRRPLARHAGPDRRPRRPATRRRASTRT